MAEHWELDGTYMEACTCDVGCPCVFLSEPTQGDCKGLVAWHIDRGRYGDTTLDGTNIALALHAPGNMKDGNWKVALYLDESASPEQKEALTAIFGGQAGGHPAVLGQHIGEVLGVSEASIRYRIDGKRHSLRIGDVAAADIEAVPGQDGGDVVLQGHPLAVGPGHPMVVAKSQKAEYKDQGYDWTISDRNGFFSRFTYQGP